MLKDVLLWLVSSILISQLSQIVLSIYLKKTNRLVLTIDALFFDSIILSVGLILLIIRGISYQYFFDLLVVGALLIIYRFDNFTLMIPNLLSLLILILGIMKMIMTRSFDLFNTAMSVIFLVSGVLLNLYYRKKKGTEAMGYGDLKLIFVYALYMSVLHASIALFIACICAIFVEIIVKKRSRKMFPFGPYLAIGMIIGLFLKFI